MNAVPLVSVIIPVQNREREIRECIRAIRRSTYTAIEIIVVDDASTDATPLAAAEEGAVVLSMAVAGDANQCRNAGALSAKGDVLLFLDSDVLITPASVTEVVNTLNENQVAAVIGTYTVAHRNRNLASRYKNLWIRYSYLRGGSNVDWIFGAIAAVRASDYHSTGGFDANFLSGKGGEDLELGARLVAAGKQIVFSGAVEAEHLKKHTVWSLLKNDFLRSEGFFVLAARQGRAGKAVNKGFANIYPAFILSTLLAPPLVASIPVAATEELLLPVPLALSGLYAAMNSGFLRYFAHHYGAPATVLALLLMLCDHVVCAVGSCKGLFSVLLTKAGVSR